MSSQAAPKRRASPPPKSRVREQVRAQPEGRRRGPRQATPFVAVAVALFLLWRYADDWARYLRYIPGGHIIHAFFGSELMEGHADFGDGRATTAPPGFCSPTSTALHYVNVMLGNGGPEPNLSGGMIPAVAPPFAMTRWTPQTRQNYVSMCPYNQTDTRLHGFIGTHQPAVWMGESGPAQIFAGLGNVVTDFEKRGLDFDRADEYASANYYRNVLQAPHGNIEVEMSATSRVGHIRYTFHKHFDDSKAAPFIVLDASRASVITSDPTNITYPQGTVTIDKKRNEMYGWNDERQDHILVGEELPAKNFKGYFVARFDQPIVTGGITRGGGRPLPIYGGEGMELSGWAQFDKSVKVINARIGVSFISIDQARRNLDLEIPDHQDLETTARQTRVAWADKLDRMRITGATEQNLTVAYSGYAHTLVYPYEISENVGTATSPKWRYYSGYLDKVVDGISYSGYSIWDTFRAATAWQLFVALERVPDMITSMLQDYTQGGWLPMWKNIVETNIMVGTHADSIIAQAMRAGVTGFDYDLAWKAVRKDAFTPPERDTELRYDDRDEHTPQEVRAGLTEYEAIGWVADDLHAESGSRTLDYAYDDHAAAIVAETVGATADAARLYKRSKQYRNLWNAKTEFMEARFANGSWAGEDAGWTEGDHWAYTLNVMHDVPGLIDLMGGKQALVNFLDRHFDGGHNLHTNEPSHHIPYFYAWAEPAKAQAAVRKLGREEYNHTDIGLSGNEDCGQMSAWYLFSMMGFYPVDPASATYIIGSPFFDRIELDLTPKARIVVSAPGASKGKTYVRGVKIDGIPHDDIIITHAQLANGALIEFDMADTPQPWPESK